MKITRNLVGKKVIYGDNSGYFLIEGFERHDKKRFAFGILGEGHYEGMRPDNPRRSDKSYYVINATDADNFKRYKKSKALVGA